MKLKEKYKRFKMDGVLYDFTYYNEEKLRNLWNNQPHLRYMFEDEIPQELIEIGIETEQQFDDIIKEVVKPKRKRK